MSQKLHQLTNASSFTESSSNNTSTSKTKKVLKHTDASRYMVTPRTAEQEPPVESSTAKQSQKSYAILDFSPRKKTALKDNDVLIESIDVGDSFEQLMNDTGSSVDRDHVVEEREGQKGQDIESNSDSYYNQLENSSIIEHLTDERAIFEFNSHPLSHVRLGMTHDSTIDCGYNLSRDLLFVDWASELSRLAQEQIQLYKALVARRYKLFYQFDILNSIVNDHALKLQLEEDQLVEKINQFKMGLAEIIELNL